MKTTCIATVAILGCASAAPRRMRTSERQLQDVASLSLSLSSTEAIATDLSVPTIDAIGSVIGSVDFVENAGSLPGDEIVVDEVLWASLSLPAIYEQIHGEGSATPSVIAGSMSMSMSAPAIVSGGIPDGWTPEQDGYIPSPTGEGYVAGPDVVPATTDDVSGGITSTDDVASDDVPAEGADSASAISIGLASAAAVVGALALF